MKPYLILLVLVAAAIGVYLLTNDSGTDPSDPGARGRRGGAPGRRVAAPESTRPNVPQGERIQTRDGEAFRVIDPQIKERIEQLENLTWSSTVTEETLVRAEDGWRHDYSQVDFEAPVLCVVDGIEITREDYRRWAVIQHGMPLVRARLMHMAGEVVAQRYETPQEQCTLTDEQFAKYQENWAAKRQMTAEEAASLTSIQLKLPVEAALRVRRDYIESVLAFYPPVETAEQLPEEIHAVIEPEQLGNVFTLLSVLDSIRGQLDTDEGIAKLAGVFELMMAMMGDVVDYSVFRRGWTAVDGPLPEGKVAGFVAGELTEGSLLPPWQEPGEKLHVDTEEMYAAIEPALGRANKEDALRIAVWSKLLRSRLAERDVEPSDEQAWVDWAEEYLRGQETFFDAEFVAKGLLGYSTMPFYRETKRLLRGFERSLPAGWDDPANLRAFFLQHRFFIQRWQPVLDVALFLPRDLSDGVGDIDWDAARRAAEAFHARVEAGESFDELLVEHNAVVAEQLRSSMGAAISGDFARFTGGPLNLSPSELRKALEKGFGNELLDGYSVIRNAAVRLDKGEVGPPWRAPIGYVVVRMNNARLSGLEDEYEDLAYDTETEYVLTHFLRWVQESLAKGEVTIPE